MVVILGLGQDGTREKLHDYVMKMTVCVTVSFGITKILTLHYTTLHCTLILCVLFV